MSEVVEAAARIDEVLWEYSDQFIQQTASSEQAWGQARDQLEAARLEFINTARLHVDPQHMPLNQAPVARPPLPDARRTAITSAPDRETGADAA